MKKSTFVVSSSNSEVDGIDASSENDILSMYSRKRSAFRKQENVQTISESD